MCTNELGIQYVRDGLNFKHLQETLVPSSYDVDNEIQGRYDPPGKRWVVGVNAVSVGTGYG